VAQRELRVRLREQARATEGLGAPTSDARTPTPPLASVIVVCRDAGDVLGRCLEHLLAQDYPAVEIIVVDDASGDDTVAVAQAKASNGQLTVVRSPRHRGCPNARNIGVRHANGAIIAFIDADGFATPSWLSELVRMFASDPEIGAVASAVFYDDNPLVLNGAGGTVNRQGWAADLAMNESYEVAQIAAEALYPMGCGMAIRREALVRVGPFDDRMLNYYDDVDYGIRVWRAGYRVAVAADAWVEHGAMRGNSERKRLLCERHRMRVVLKHAPRATLREWATNELMSLWHAPRAVRARKLKAAAWNLQRFPSLLADRRLQRCSAPAPTRLIDSSWGDAFPAGITERADPRPELARDAVAIDDAGSDAQLVGYPIVDLKRHRQDLHWYLRKLEEVLINTLADYGIPGERNISFTGVWTRGKKIASIGVHARDWVTWHGFALNVTTDLSYFDLIVPCGINGVVMTSIAREVGAEEVSAQDVQERVAAKFAEAFDLTAVVTSRSALLESVA
jgi:lipoate-protein ligase B